jgi:hypothetical protein
MAKDLPPVQHMTRKLFLLSPASTSGRRAQLLFNERAQFPLAQALHSGAGASLGEVFSFLSGLYFRGKLAYARTFAENAADIRVITPDRGLLHPDTVITLDDLRAFSTSPIELSNERYTEPLMRDALALSKEPIAPIAPIASIAPIAPIADITAILLGSIASAKYTDILLHVYDDRLLFPQDFIGRGDMSRGGLMLRCVDNNEELTYVPVSGAIRHGKRPPRLNPR